MTDMTDMTDMTAVNHGGAEMDARNVTTETEDGGVLGADPSAGGGQEISHATVPHADLTVRDAVAMDQVEANVEDLSIGVYAPSSHALVVKVHTLFNMYRVGK